jgi:hypothetical protein
MVTLQAKLLKSAVLQAPEISEITKFLQNYSDHGEFRIKHNGREPRAFLYDGFKKMAQFFLDPETHVLTMIVDGNYKFNPETLEDLKDFLITIGFTPEGDTFVKNKLAKTAAYEEINPERNEGRSLAEALTKTLNSLVKTYPVADRPSLVFRTIRMSDQNPNMGIYISCPKDIEHGSVFVRVNIEPRRKLYIQFATISKDSDLKPFLSMAEEELTDQLIAQGFHINYESDCLIKDL